MIVRFNKAQLGRDMENKIDQVLSKMQAGTDIEVEIVAVDFPNRFEIKVGDDVSVLVWDAETNQFKFIGVPFDADELAAMDEPETIPESKKETVDEPGSKPDDALSDATKKAIREVDAQAPKTKPEPSQEVMDALSKALQEKST